MVTQIASMGPPFFDGGNLRRKIDTVTPAGFNGAAVF